MPAAVSGKRTQVYALDSFKLKSGTQLPRLHEYFQRLLPAISKIHHGPKIFLEAIVAPHIPQVAAVYGFESVDEMWSVHTKLLENNDLRKSLEALEGGPEPAFESLDTRLLEATAYSPEIAVSSDASRPPRVFELRVYHSPTWRQLKALHERFAGPEIKIFHRVGIHPVLYSSTLIGQDLPNLTYLIPFDDLAAREKAWNAFGADPEWVKVRKESTDRSGQIASTIQISLWKAAAYSPVK